MYYVSRILAWFAIATLIAAASFSIHLARADAEFRRGDPVSVARAIAIEPRNSEYLTLRALQLDYDGAESTPLLEHAAALNPLSSSPRLRLGLAAEIRGDYDSAERWLLDAARVDHQFEPRWTLANFYFRRANAPASGNSRGTAAFWTSRGNAAFWTFMSSALEVSYGDRRPAFDLCWRMAGDTGSAEILDRAIPNHREVLTAYLLFLLESHRDAVAPVAMKLARFHEPADRPILFAASDALIDAARIPNRPEVPGTPGRDTISPHQTTSSAGYDAAVAGREAASAVELWTAMGVARPSGVFNGDFSSVPLNHGFDWRQIESRGVTHASIDPPRSAHRISFDGRQPESCVLLIQILNLEPNTRYTLRWEARTSGIKSPTGIEWRIGDRRAAIDPSESASAGTADFTATTELAPLTLFYQRPSGEARAEGSIDLTRVWIEHAR
jgi:hypothetical protein